MHPDEQREPIILYIKVILAKFGKGFDIKHRKTG